MCDTFVAMNQATADGSVILGKNSDREVNEAHQIQVVPAQDYAAGSQVQCTYVSIPQVEHTYAVLLAKPFWIWGAEMGVNEHGVAIGNEAIFTRVPYEKGAGLIGMDFLRLGLERARSADEALRVITTLLEAHGQGGSCGFTHGFYYHNSYLIADPHSAWVLETAGRQWVAQKVSGYRSISNAATIGSDWDLASSDLVSYAVDHGWCKSAQDFHFARCYSDFLYTRLSDASHRQSCTSRCLAEKNGGIQVHDAMQFLRMHGEESADTLRLDRSLLGASVCMHASAGPVRNSQSVGSLVAHLTDLRPTIWVTGTSAPCTSIFKPMWIDSGVPLAEPSPEGTYDERCLWWRHEKLHRAVLRNYQQRSAVYSAERDDLEDQFCARVEQCGDSVEMRREFSKDCFQAAGAAEARWMDQVLAIPEGKPRIYYRSAWKQFDQQAKIDEAGI